MVTGVGGKTPVLGIGTVLLMLKVGEQSIQHTLKDVLHVPDSDNALLSLTAFDRAGGQTICGGGECKLTKNGKVLSIGKQRGKLYYMEIDQGSEPSARSAKSTAVSWDDRHERYGHIAISGIH